MDPLIIVLTVVALLILPIVWPKRALFCPACGHTGAPKKALRGSVVVEIVLWALSLALAVFYFWAFIFVGLIYSIWLVSTRHKVCKLCGAAGLIPTESPMAKKLMKDLS